MLFVLTSGAYSATGSGCDRGSKGASSGREPGGVRTSANEPISKYNPQRQVAGGQGESWRGRLYDGLQYWAMRVDVRTCSAVWWVAAGLYGCSLVSRLSSRGVELALKRSDRAV